MHIVYYSYDDYDSHSTSNIFVTNEQSYAEKFVVEQEAISKSILHKLNGVISQARNEIEKSFGEKNPFIDMKNMSVEEKKLAKKMISQRDEQLLEILIHFDEVTALDFLTHEEKSFVKSYVSRIKDIENMSFGSHEIPFIQV